MSRHVNTSSSNHSHDRWDATLVHNKLNMKHGLHKMTKTCDWLNSQHQRIWLEGCHRAKFDKSPMHWLFVLTFDFWYGVRWAKSTNSENTFQRKCTTAKSKIAKCKIANLHPHPHSHHHPSFIVSPTLHFAEKFFAIWSIRSKFFRLILFSLIPIRWKLFAEKPFAEWPPYHYFNWLIEVL